MQKNKIGMSIQPYQIDEHAAPTFRSQFFLHPKHEPSAALGRLSQLTVAEDTT